MQRSFDDICDNGLPYLYRNAKDFPNAVYTDGWTGRLLEVVCAGAVETLGLERTLELLDQQRERLTARTSSS